MAEVIFIDGMIVKRNDKAPDFVKCQVTFKAHEFKVFLDANQNDGWMNVDIKESKNGKLYASLNNWKPKQDVQSVHQSNDRPHGTNQPQIDDSVPF
jgi:hypothetical protein